MELLLDTEQEMLRESSAVLASRNRGMERLRSGEARIDRHLWSEIAEAGYFAILVTEQDGGLGLGLMELCLVCHQFGRQLVPEPVAEAAAAAQAMAGLADDAATVGALMAGRAIILPALMQSDGVQAPGPTSSSYLDTDGIRIFPGVWIGVSGAADADGFLVEAKETRENADVIINLPASATSLESVLLADGTSAGSLRITGQGGRLLAGPNRGSDTLAVLHNTLNLATAAQLLGVMEAAHEMTVEYLKTREQFNRPIGSFQALQHRAVDNLAAVEACRSLVYQAARAIDSGAGQAGLSSAALSFASERALSVCKSAIQMHGGIGFTAEHDVGLYLKRAMVLSARYGSPRQHRDRFRAAAQSS